MKWIQLRERFKCSWKFMSSCAPKCAFVLHAILIVSGAHNFTIHSYAMLGMKEYIGKVCRGWMSLLPVRMNFRRGREENGTIRNVYSDEIEFERMPRTTYHEIIFQHPMCGPCFHFLYCAFFR